MTLRTSIFRNLVLLAATGAAYGQSVEVRPYISEDDVAGGMRDRGVIVRPKQVSLLSNIPARSEHPALELVKIEPLSPTSSRVLMRCIDRGSCIPFYVVVSGLVSTDQGIEVSPKDRVASAQKTASGPIVMKRGSKATLQIVAPQMLITIQVVCLQNGRQGEKIKVTSTDQKNTYSAEIVSPGLLRSGL